MIYYDIVCVYIYTYIIIYNHIYIQYLISMKQGGTSIPLILPPEMTRGQSTKKAFSQRIGAWVVALCKMGLREKNMADFWAKQRSKNPLAKRLDILSICGSIISVPCRAYHPGK
jgi:hypothetical protein